MRSSHRYFVFSFYVLCFKNRFRLDFLFLWVKVNDVLMNQTAFSMNFKSNKFNHFIYRFILRTIAWVNFKRMQTKRTESSKKQQTQLIYKSTHLSKTISNTMRLRSWFQSNLMWPEFHLTFHIRLKWNCGLSSELHVKRPNQRCLFLESYFFWANCSKIIVQ